MTAQAPIATRTVLAIEPNGWEFCLTLGVGRPYEISPGEWACPLFMEGLHERLVDQHGVDSWQILQLAYQLIAQLLGYFVQDGSALYWPESRERMTLSELVPQTTTNSTWQS
jgi:hypothetical protein